MGQTRKNLLYIMTDHQRIDTLNKVVNGIEITPNLNRLIAGGAHFETTYNTCPLCVPARTALATGINPIKNGMVLNDLKGVGARDHKTLHERLLEGGYDIAHVGVHHVSTKPNIREKLDFKRWEDEDTYNAYARSVGIEPMRKPEDASLTHELCETEYQPRTYSNHRVSEFTYELKHFKDYWFVSQGIDYLKEEHENPFALFVCMWAPHPPLMVPEPYASMFDPESMELPENVGCIPDQEPASRRKGVPAQLADGVTMEEWKKTWAAHYALVKMCDDQIGRMLDTLKEQNLLEDTMIVFTTDHGEHLGQHNMYQKMEMYETAVRIPAIFYGSDIQQGAYSTPISHLNFVPTILDVLEIPTEDVFEADSLKETLLHGTMYEDKPVFSVYCGNPARGDMRRMVVYQGFKLVYDGSNQFELFDLKQDPLEMNNLTNDSEYSQQKEKLYGILKDWAIKNNDFIEYLDI